MLTLRLATVREDGEPTRRRAAREEFSEEEWRLVTELADYPNRLLVTITTEMGETYAEVAHEAIFRRWSKLREWIAGARDFLIWRSGLETARRAWQTAPESAKGDALLMGFALAQAQSWLIKRAGDLPGPDRVFIGLSVARAIRARGRARRALALVYLLLVGVIIGLVGWINEAYVKEQANWFLTMRPYMLANFRPYVLTTEHERALKSGDNLRNAPRIALSWSLFRRVNSRWAHLKRRPVAPTTKARNMQ